MSSYKIYFFQKNKNKLMRMTLKDLITEIQKNPTLIKTHYEILTKYIETENIEELTTIMDPAFEHYFYMIIEEKLKYFSKNQIDPQGLIDLVIQYEPLTNLGKNKYTIIISLLGIFYFPLKFDIIEFLNKKGDSLSNEILNRFVYQILNNYDITESRRSELKRAMKLSTVLFIERVYKNLHLIEYLDTFNLLIQIIDIDPNSINMLLSILNTNRNEDWLNKLSETVAIINYNSKIDILEFLKISEHIEPTPSFSKMLLEKNYVNHKYFYNAINEENVTYSIKYFTKHIGIVNNEVVLKFLALYMNSPDRYNSNTDLGAEKREEIFRFFIVLAKSEKNIEILNTVKFPNKITIQFLKNIKTDEFYLISNKDLFIESYLKIQNRDISILNSIPLLIKEEESKKLVLRVIEDYKLEKVDLENLLNFFYIENTKNIKELCLLLSKGLLNNNTHRITRDKEIKEGGLEELIVKTLKRLEIPLTLKIDRSNIKLYYYFIRDNSEKIDVNLIKEFYEYCLNTNDLFMCFEILSQIVKKDVNTKVFEYLLSIVDKLNLEDLINLIELCRKLEFSDVFLINISNRLIYISGVTTEYELLDKTVNKFLSVNKNDNTLINLLVINEYNIFKRLLNLFKNRDLKDLDLNRIVYLLLMKYSNPEFHDLQQYIIGVLLKIMKISYSPFTVYQSEGDIHSKVQSLSEKKGRAIMKGFLNSIKATKFSDMGSKGKVDQQYLFTKSRNNEDVDLSTFL